jgi:hypothetical protein
VIQKEFKMKLLSAVFAVAVLVSAAVPAGAAEPRTSGSGKLTVPKGAVESEPGTFHFVDAQGKKWIYRQTPFGIARLEDAPESKPVTVPDPAAGAKAVADGDTIRFERPGPFGTYRWQKNRSELSEMEQAIWNQQLAKSAAK